MQCFDCIAKLIRAVSGEQAYAGCSANIATGLNPSSYLDPYVAGVVRWQTAPRQQFQRGNAQLFQIVDHHRSPRAL